MKLIVGLGNPGIDYKNTRHNIGFMFLDYFAKLKNLSFDKEKFNAKYLEYSYKGEKFLLIKPLSFMNLSGGVVKKYVDYFKIDLDDVLIIQDDLDMSFGRVKFVYDSSSGGHNGIKDIEFNLGTKKYSRLKIGISKDKSIDVKDYVLGKFDDVELQKLSIIFENLVSLIDDFGELDNSRIMNKYNVK